MRSAASKINRYVLLGVLLLLVAIPAVAIGGFSAQGFSAQGFSAQGFSAQGFSAQGFSAQGFSAQGFSAQGFSAQGFSAQGFSAQGFSAQGFSAQGFSAQGVALMGTDLIGIDIKGSQIGSVELRGATPTSSIEPHVLTNVPDDERRARATTSRSAVARRAGTTRSRTCSTPSGNPAEDLDLYIAHEQKDPDPEPVPPLRGAGQPGRALRRLLLPQVERAVDVALPLQPGDQAARRRWRSRRIRRTRTSSSSPARRPASPRSARATGATGRGPRRRPTSSTRPPTAAWAPGSWRRSI